MIVQIAGVRDEAEARLLLEEGVDELAFPLGPGVRTPDLGEREAAEIIAGLQLQNRAVVITYLEEAGAIASLVSRTGARKVQLHGAIAAAEARRLKEIAPHLFVTVTLAVGEEPLATMESRARELEPFVDAFFTDTFDPSTGARGATGIPHDWQASRRLCATLRRPLILAGGLTPANVRAAIVAVRPAGVDAHTGVEGPDGRKDRALVRAFVAEARVAFRETSVRPPCIRHYREIQSGDDAHYPGSCERLSIGSPFGAVGGLRRLGVHHEVLPPGRRTSWPHAESTEEEFVFVLEGNPEVWLDGHVYPLAPGDGVTFPSGTGISHTFLNRTTREARLLVVGERRDDNQVYYPLHPGRREQIGAQWWETCPRHELGPDRAEPQP